MIRYLVSCAVLGLVALLARPAGAVEYRLQVTNLEYRTFAAHLEDSRSAWRQDESMRRLEVELDQEQFPTQAVLPGREVHLLEDPAYGGTIPARLAVLPATRQQAWTTMVWDGPPGTPVVFVVKSDVLAWPQVWMVAADAGGGLRRLSLGGCTRWTTRAAGPGSLGSISRQRSGSGSLRPLDRRPCDTARWPVRRGGAGLSCLL
jgi:hypothetical protein